MLKALPMAVVAHFHGLFRMLFYDHGNVIPTSWRNIVMFFSKKINVPSMLNDFRGICLLDVVSKSYAAALTTMIGEVSLPQHYQQLLPFGNGSIGAESVIGAFSMILGKSSEWERSNPIHVFEMDVQTAYDNLHPKLIEKALIARGVHPWLVSGILKLIANLTLNPSFPNIQQHEGGNNRSCSACIRQGEVESGKLWQIALQYVLGPLLSIWKEEACRGFQT